MPDQGFLDSPWAQNIPFIRKVAAQRQQNLQQQQMNQYRQFQAEHLKAETEKLKEEREQNQIMVPNVGSIVRAAEEEHEEPTGVSEPEQLPGGIQEFAKRKTEGQMPLRDFGTTGEGQYEAPPTLPPPLKFQVPAKPEQRSGMTVGQIKRLGGALPYLAPQLGISPKATTTGGIWATSPTGETKRFGPTETVPPNWKKFGEKSTTAIKAPAKIEEAAYKLFGKPFAELTEEEKTQARKEEGTMTEKAADKYRVILAKPEIQRTPQERAYATAYEKEKQLGPAMYAEGRKEVIREQKVEVLDTTTGDIELMTWGEAQDANKGEKSRGLGSRYVLSSTGQKIMSKQAGFKEIEVSSETYRKALTNLQTEFTTVQLAKLAEVLEGHPEGSGRVTKSVVRNIVAKTLNDDQIELVTAILNLRESAFALRSLQSLGQSSDMVRGAIDDLIGAGILNKKYNISALDKFDNEIASLKTGVPGLGGAGRKIPGPELQLKGGGEKKPTVYKTKEDVKAAVASGQLNRDDGIKILREQFGMK